MFITDQPIPLEKFLTEKADPSSGAVACFVGVVRNHHGGRRVKKIYYECYPSMANKEIGLLIESIKRRHGVNEIKLIHRVGWLEVGEAALAITVSSAHREEAFRACRAVIDDVKVKVPIWKKEIYDDGSGDWVLSCLDTEGTAS